MSPPEIPCTATRATVRRPGEVSAWSSSRDGRSLGTGFGMPPSGAQGDGVLSAGVHGQVSTAPSTCCCVISRSAVAPSLPTVDLRQARLNLVVRSSVPADWSGVPRGALAEAPKTRGTRVSHTRPEHVRTWFSHRLQPSGEPAVALNGVTRIGADAETGRLALRMLPRVSGSAPHKGLRIARAEIKGTPTVADPKAFVTALTRGIGYARACSCGLMLAR
ncbi:type I-E CRISPR-associated protein Cas6/Cse3/CasE [Streptomyces sp. NPDC001714]|uniref:type I-E CRISPR-associated protein Cas6/Cse3/CasE n=1 Tax=Streptomyces sp. NPDC001714 TaxID=3364603 RepID=UPI00367537FC